MPRKLTPNEETQLLKDATREAHEVLNALRAALRTAAKLAPNLVKEFEAIHRSEIEVLSNFFTEESNKQSAYLNATVEQARALIMNQIMAGEAVFDRETTTVTIRFGARLFDEHVPPPYPNRTTKEIPQ